MHNDSECSEVEKTVLTWMEERVASAPKFDIEKIKINNLWVIKRKPVNSFNKIIFLSLKKNIYYRTGHETF